MNCALDGGAYGSVDMEKLAALKEQHYLNAMSSQLQSKFSLNATSAKRMATVAHQFNKVAGSRDLTEADASAFTKELIGVDLGEITTAVDESRKGKSEKLNSLLEKAAGQVGTLTENFNEMVFTIFN
jgi:hypothetical protein